MQTPFRSKKKTVEVRFWALVDRSAGPDECWPWMGHCNCDGYGLFSFSYGKGNYVRAHRMAWILTFGPISSSIKILHHCDNPPCCNPGPKHLFKGTQKDNIDDMVAKGRHGNTKVSLDQAAAIRCIYSSGNASMRILAIKYNVCAQTIWNIVHDKVRKSVLV